ncbi:unnamed protein product [Closterium sp. NIES-53]
MALRSSSVLMRVPLPSPPASSLPYVLDPASDLARAAIAELVDFAVAYRLDYATSLVADSESDCPPSVGGECALGTDVPMLLALEGDPDAPDIPTPRFYAEAITGPYSSQWHTAMYTEMAS